MHLRGCPRATLDGPCCCDSIRERVDIRRKAALQALNDGWHIADLNGLTFEDWVIGVLADIMAEP